MAEKIEQHAHCPMCGKAIPISEKLCSEACSEKYKAMIKKGRMLRYIMFALMFVFLLMILFSTNIF